MTTAAPTGTRRSMQSQAVRRALEDSGGFISAQQLHQRLADERTPVGVATVYRQLNALAEAGHADTIPVAGGQLFRACAEDAHHHHLICENCGKAVEIDPPDEGWLQDTARTHGFTVTRHILEVFGRCADCAA